MENLNNVKNRVEKAFKNYGENLKKFWPAQYGDCQQTPKERNITLYVGSEFLKDGYVVFQEVPIDSEKSSSPKLDMVAIANETMILMEAKRLYDGDEAKEICNDIDKMKNCEIIDNKKLFGSEVSANTIIYCVLAQTFIKDWYNFWKRKGSLQNSNSAMRLLAPHLASANDVWTDSIYMEKEPDYEYELFGMAAFFLKS